MSAGEPRRPQDKPEWESHYDRVVPLAQFDTVAHHDPRDPYFKRLAQLGAGARRSLEFGSGRGVGSYTLKDANRTTDTTLLDFSEHAVAYSRELFRHRRFAAGFVVGSFLQLPFPSGHFDLVFGHTVLEHVRDTATAVAELVRVTAPGGHLLVTVPNRNRRFGHDMYHIANNLKYFSRTFAIDELAGFFRSQHCDILEVFGIGLMFMPVSLIPRYLYRKLRGSRMAEADDPEDAAPVSPDAKRPSGGVARGLVRAADDAVLWVQRNLGFALVSRGLVPARWLITIGIVARKRQSP